MKNFFTHRHTKEGKLCSSTGSFFDLVFMILRRRESLTAEIFIYDLNMSQCIFASSWISKRSLKVHKFFSPLLLCSFALKSSPILTPNTTIGSCYLKENFTRTSNEDDENDGVRREIWRKKNGKTHWKFNLTFA